MSSTTHPSLTRSLAFRLTLMYASISTASLVVVLAVSYLVLQSALQRRLDQGLCNEIGEYSSLLRAQSIEIMRDVLEREAVSEGTDKVFFRILDAAGHEVLATDMIAWADVNVRRSHLVAAAEGKTVFETYRHRDRPYPSRIVYGPAGRGWVFQLGESTEGNAEVLQRFRQVFALTTVAFVCCSMVLGNFMARRALSGVQRVTQTAKDISSGAWDSRVPLSRRHDEIDELAEAFNEMVERIQVLVGELKEVTDDIAHDLRTPITRMRAAAETALQNAGGNLEQQEMAGNILEECDRLLGLINTMLEISQTEAGGRGLALERIDLSGIVEDVVDLFRASAEDKRLTLAFRDCPGLLVQGDLHRLKPAIAHLIDNAVKYTDPGGTIAVTCRRDAEAARVTVEDTGIGISESDWGNVFARFYRVDPSRSQSGNGLGLSLARAICRAHGGDLTVESVLGQGSTFEIVLPVKGA